MRFIHFENARSCLNHLSLTVCLNQFRVELKGGVAHHTPQGVTLRIG